MDKDFRPVDSSDSSVWARGFELTSAGLVCLTCRAMVRKTPGDAQAHREWDAKIQQLVSRTLGG